MNVYLDSRIIRHIVQPPGEFIIQKMIFYKACFILINSVCSNDY